MELIEAVQSGNLQQVKHVIANTRIPIDYHWFDYIALNNALFYRHVVIADYLLSIGCRVNMDVESEFGPNTPLHNAVSLEDVDLVEKLLEKEASILATNAEGNTPLHLAFLFRNEMIMDLLLDTLQRKENFVNVKNTQGLSHMHIACTRKYSKAVESFVASGVDLTDCVEQDAYLWSGYSALHFAVEFRSFNAVKAILNSNAQTNLFFKDNFYGLTPLSLAQQQLEDLSAIVQLFSDRQAEDNVIQDKEEIEQPEEFFKFENKVQVKESFSTGLSAFHMACMETNSDNVEHFINNGASVHQPVVSHIDLFHLYTPLHLAVENKCKKSVEILLKHGADVNLQNSDRMTPLHLALYVNDHDDKQHIIDYLYAAVDNKLANPKDANGLSYLHIACTRNDLATVTYLLAVSEDVNAQVQRNSRNVPNFTSLHFAVEYEHAEMAKLLIERGANVNRYSLEGTPLHLACKHGHTDLVGLLLDNGAEVDETMTLHPLVEAYANSRNSSLLDYVERLVSLGVDVDAKNALGNTALHAFCSRSDSGNDKCLRFLLDLGANVNLENDEGQTAFELCGDSAVFYHHVQELKALGVRINPKNEECCQKMLLNADFAADDENLERLKKQRTEEMTYMQNIKLTKLISLDEFLRLDPEDARFYTTNEVLRLIVGTNNLTKCFPSYAYLIKLQYCRALGSFGVRKKKNVFECSIEAKRRCV